MREWFSNPAAMPIALGAALLLFVLARLLRRTQYHSAEPRSQTPQHRPPEPRQTQNSSVGKSGTGGPPMVWTAFKAASNTPTTNRATNSARVAGTNALRNPPGVRESLVYMAHASPNTPYLLPLGWHFDINDERDLVHTTLLGETNNIIVTGQLDSGKDNLAWWMLLSLALQHPSQEVQFCIVDGKGLDFGTWKRKEHTWALATISSQITPLMRRLSAERERRREHLQAAGVSKWDNYQGADLPLLVVFISELSLLEQAIREESLRIRALSPKERPSGWVPLDLETWLNAEMTSGRAFGIRYIIGMQSVSGMDTLWRGQTSIYMAGYNPDPGAVKPNTNRTPKQIEESGGTPPFKIPPPPLGAGVFTVVSGADSMTVRATFILDEERSRWLSQLPDHVGDREDTLSRLLRESLADLPALASNLAEPTEELKAANSPTRGRQNFAGLEDEFAAPESDFVVSDLQFSPTELATIAARIVVETMIEKNAKAKTTIVTTMPGYDSREHARFAAYYDMLYSSLADQGLVPPAPNRRRRLERVK